MYTVPGYRDLKERQFPARKHELMDAAVTARKWMSHDAERSKGLSILLRGW